MKKTVFLSYLALLLCFVLPLSRRDRPAVAAPPPPVAEEAAALPSPAPSAAPAESPSPAAPAPETLRVLTAEGLREMRMQDYLPGVVAAEMPAAFPEEALKAQAIYAYTTQSDMNDERLDTILSQIQEQLTYDPTDAYLAYFYP